MTEQTNPATDPGASASPPTMAQALEQFLRARRELRAAQAKLRALPEPKEMNKK